MTEAEDIIEDSDYDFLIENVNKKHIKVIEEIIKTEVAYYRDVVSLINNYYSSMLEKSWSTEASEIFGNILEIQSFEVKLLKEMKTHLRNIDSFSQIFISLMDEFIQIYGKYLTNYVHALVVYENFESNHEFKIFIEDIKTKLGQKLPLSSYLLKPVQRILKYNLLLKSLAEALFKDSIPNEITLKSQKTMEDVASTINSMKKNAEDRNKFLAYKNYMSNLINFEIENCGTYVINFDVKWNSFPYDLLILERYVLLIQNLQDKKITRKLECMRDIEFSVDKKKEKYIIITFNENKHHLKMSDSKTLKKVFSVLTNARHNIMEKLQNSEERLKEFCLPKLMISENHASEIISDDDEITKREKISAQRSKTGISLIEISQPTIVYSNPESVRSLPLSKAALKNKDMCIDGSLNSRCNSTIIGTSSKNSFSPQRIISEYSSSEVMSQKEKNKGLFSHTSIKKFKNKFFAETSNKKKLFHDNSTSFNHSNSSGIDYNSSNEDIKYQTLGSCENFTSLDDSFFHEKQRFSNNSLTLDSETINHNISGLTSTSANSFQLVEEEMEIDNDIIDKKMSFENNIDKNFNMIKLSGLKHYTEQKIPVFYPEIPPKPDRYKNRTPSEIIAEYIE